MFHRNCLDEWKKKEKHEGKDGKSLKCPNCKKPVYDTVSQPKSKLRESVGDWVNGTKAKPQVDDDYVVVNNKVR